MNNKGLNVNIDKLWSGTLSRTSPSFSEFVIMPFSRGINPNGSDCIWGIVKIYQFLPKQYMIKKYNFLVNLSIRSASIIILHHSSRKKNHVKLSIRIDFIIVFNQYSYFYDEFFHAKNSLLH